MAGRIPRQFIDELITRVDIVEVIDMRVRLRKAGRNYVACCPFHEEKTPSFTVSHQKQFYHCFGCGAHGTALGFLMEYEHMDFIEAVRELAGQAGLDVPQEPSGLNPGQQLGAPHGADAHHGTPSKDLYDLLEQSASFYRKQLREHAEAGRAIDYLKRRGLSGEIAARYGIGYAPPGWDNLLHALAPNGPGCAVRLAEAGMLIEKESGGHYDRFRDRIMFPICDRRGRTIGFGGRVLSDDDLPKYLNSPETPLFHKGHELYGLYQTRKASHKLDRLLVVEGYMDVVALAQYGIDYAVATLGTATTREHLELLFRLAPSVVFCFDGDRAGREAAWRALENAMPAMRAGRQGNFLFLPEGEDPDSLVRKEGRERFEERIARAVTLSDFFYETLLKKVDTSKRDGRARLVELARPLLSKLPLGVFRQLLIAPLADMVRMDADKLNRALGQEAGKAGRTAKGLSQRERGFAPMSLMRLALALLLQRPSLAQQTGDPQHFAGLDMPGADLLVNLLELLQSQPHLTCAALLERWRDTEQGHYLLKLAQWQHPVPEEGVEAEFGVILKRLLGEGLEQRKEYLLNKSRLVELTEQEKLELQELFAGRPALNSRPS